MVMDRVDSGGRPRTVRRMKRMVGGLTPENFKALHGAQSVVALAFDADDQAFWPQRPDADGDPIVALGATDRKLLQDLLAELKNLNQTLSQR